MFCFQTPLSPSQAIILNNVKAIPTRHNIFFTTYQFTHGKTCQTETDVKSIQLSVVRSNLVWDCFRMEELNNITLWTCWDLLEWMLANKIIGSERFIIVAQKGYKTCVTGLRISKLSLLALNKLHLTSR